MSVKIIHNPHCSKSRATLQLLQDQGLEPEIQLYLESPPSTAELESILNLLGLQPRDLMRTGEAEYQQLGLADDTLSAAHLISAMVANPRLIERPIVLAYGKAALGRPPESVLEIL